MPKKNQRRLKLLGLLTLCVATAFFMVDKTSSYFATLPGTAGNMAYFTAILLEVFLLLMGVFFVTKKYVMNLVSKILLIMAFSLTVGFAFLHIAYPDIKKMKTVLSSNQTSIASRMTFTSVIEENKLTLRNNERTAVFYRAKGQKTNLAILEKENRGIRAYSKELNAKLMNIKSPINIDWMDYLPILGACALVLLFQSCSIFIAVHFGQLWREGTEKIDLKQSLRDNPPQNNKGNYFPSKDFFDENKITPTYMSKKYDVNPTYYSGILNHGNLILGSINNEMREKGLL